METEYYFCFCFVFCFSRLDFCMTFVYQAYECISVCSGICAPVCALARFCTRVCIHVYVRVCMHACVCVYLCVRVCVRVCICIGCCACFVEVLFFIVIGRCCSEGSTPNTDRAVFLDLIIGYNVRRDWFIGIDSGLGTFDLG